jgi:cytochrome d ubiquinol oxidase subunit I
MAYSAGLMFLLGLWGLWLIRRRSMAGSRWFLTLAVWTVTLPFLMNTAGWLLTESGRQPWIVQGIMLTKNAVSPSVGLGSVITSLTVFVAAYLTLAIVDLMLMIRYARKEAEPDPAPGDGADALVPAVRY